MNYEIKTILELGGEKINDWLEKMQTDRNEASEEYE